MKISIVMASLNHSPFLAKAIGSVLSQRGEFDLELIVMDGGSTDGTFPLLEMTGTLDERVDWVSQKNRGRVDALKRGLAKVTGDIVAWLGGDDFYEPDAFATVAQAFDQRPEAQWLIGRARMVNAQGQTVRSAASCYKDELLRQYSYRRLLRENYIPPVGVFWRRPFGQEVGPLDESLQYCMGYDLWLRMGKRARPLVLDEVLAAFRAEGLRGQEFRGQGQTASARKAQAREQYRVACRYIPADDWQGRCAHRFQSLRTRWASQRMEVAGK